MKGGALDGNVDLGRVARERLVEEDLARDAEAKTLEAVSALERLGVVVNVALVGLG